jgi:hypothetical protein
MTRAEHLAWCKERALEYVDRGELREAVTSMSSDPRKHEDFHGPIYGQLSLLGAMFEIPKGPEAVRRWINGFN